MREHRTPNPSTQRLNGAKERAMQREASRYPEAASEAAWLPHGFLHLSERLMKVAGLNAAILRAGPSVISASFGEFRRARSGTPSPAFKS